MWFVSSGDTVEEASSRVQVASAYDYGPLFTPNRTHIPDGRNLRLALEALEALDGMLALANLLN